MFTWSLTNTYWKTSSGSTALHTELSLWVNKPVAVMLFGVIQWYFALCGQRRDQAYTVLLIPAFTEILESISSLQFLLLSHTGDWINISYLRLISKTANRFCMYTHFQQITELISIHLCPGSLSMPIYTYFIYYNACPHSPRVTTCDSVSLPRFICR